MNCCCLQNTCRAKCYFFLMKVIAIVMDMLTDLQILQDLMDAAWRRSVPIYILLDDQGVPHFLDMCSRLQIGSQHLRVRWNYYIGDECTDRKQENDFTSIQSSMWCLLVILFQM